MYDHAGFARTADLIFASLDGTPLPSDPVRARIIVLERDNAGRGTYGEIDATGEIQRMVMNPVFPEGFRDWSWE